MALNVAQRRPGRESRRHTAGRGAWRRPSGTLNEGRDVNPGDTRSGSDRTALPPLAQRRPGRESRRHSCFPAPNPRRHTAQRRPGRESRRHSPRTAARSMGPATLNEGRDVNPGDTRCARRTARRGRTLNEGRDVNPGDTWSIGRGYRHRAVAQRRPGRESRRHGPESATTGQVMMRSTKAGT